VTRGRSVGRAVSHGLVAVPDGLTRRVVNWVRVAVAVNTEVRGGAQGGDSHGALSRPWLGLPETRRTKLELPP